ncbi:MAG: hypothetical protein HY670_05735 [Chloroflexi bacterium]|nr:hypothetical protein [Chloroflexota bacterium]
MANKKSRSKLIQIFIAIGIIAVIIISFGVNVLGFKKHTGIPEMLLEMKISNHVEGQQALARVNTLHGVDIPLVGAIIADYSHDFNPYHKNDDKVNVWIGKTKSAADATELINRMYQGIQQGKGNTPFSNARKITVEGREVFQTDGPGGQHYFYAMSAPEPRVIWLTISAGNPGAVLRESVKVF